METSVEHFLLPLSLGKTSIEGRNDLPVSVECRPHNACSEAKKGALESTKEGTQPLERVKEQNVNSQA